MRLKLVAMAFLLIGFAVGVSVGDGRGYQRGKRDADRWHSEWQGKFSPMPVNYTDGTTGYKCFAYGQSWDPQADGFCYLRDMPTAVVAASKNSIGTMFGRDWR